MTPDVLQLWIRAVWAKRPTSDFFRSPNILGCDMHYSHLDEEVVDTLKTVSNTTCKYTPGGMTSIMAGPDTHWNKSFKASMHDEMNKFMEAEEYKYTESGKMQPAPYSKIIDWVVKAWNAIPPEVIGNAFVQNGWEQAFNGHDTSVLHSTLRDVVENNIVRGYQRRVSPQEAAEHNEVVESIREQMFGDDVSSAEDISDEDDFDFYRLQQQDDWKEAGGRVEYNAQVRNTALPAGDVDFSAEETSDDNQEEEQQSTGGEGTSESDGANEIGNEDACSSKSKVEFLG